MDQQSTEKKNNLPGILIWVYLSLAITSLSGALRTDEHWLKILMLCSSSLLFIAVIIMMINRRSIRRNQKEIINND